MGMETRAEKGGRVLYSPSSSAFANSIISPGKISGIPPTFVDTTNKPAEAASMVLIPKASVRDVLR